MNYILSFFFGFILGYITFELIYTNQKPKKIFITKLKKDTIIKYREKVKFKKVPVVVYKTNDRKNSSADKAISITINDTLFLKDTIYLDTSYIDIYHRCERVNIFKQREWIDVYTNKNIKSLEISRYGWSRKPSISLQLGLTYSFSMKKPIPYVGIGLSYPIYTIKKCK